MTITIRLFAAPEESAEEVLVATRVISASLGSAALGRYIGELQCELSSRDDPNFFPGICPSQEILAAGGIPSTKIIEVRDTGCEEGFDLCFSVLEDACQCNYPLPASYEVGFPAANEGPAVSPGGISGNISRQTLSGGLALSLIGSYSPPGVTSQGQAFPAQIFLSVQQDDFGEDTRHGCLFFGEKQE